MTVTSPIWLWLLLPWTALAVWMFVGRRTRVFVPFAKLWKGPIRPPRSRRRLEPPPGFIILMLLAVLLGCLAAAGPGWRRDGTAACVVIADRSLTMSARGEARPRYQEMLVRLSRELSSQHPAPRIRVISVPEAPVGGEIAPQELSGFADSLPPTAADTRQALHNAVRRALDENPGTVLLLTDQSDLPHHSRLLVLSPQQPWRNVGIEHLAYRPLATGGQVLLRARNDSPLVSTEVEFLSAGSSILKQRLELPPTGQARDYFLDVPAIDGTLEARLTADDDLTTDNRAFLAQSMSWPRIELRGELPQELQRLAAQYARLRPPAHSSIRLIITGRTETLPVDSPGVLAPNPGSNADSSPRQVRLADHPILRSIADLPAVLAQATTPLQPPDVASWRPILWLDGVPALFIRESPARQVFVGFSAADFPATPQFVILWTNVLDWAGQGGAEFSARPLVELTDDLQPWPGTRKGEPGFYGEQVAPRAFNIQGVSPPPFPRPWPPLNLSFNFEPDIDSLAPAALVASLVLAGLAVLLWARAVRPVMVS